MIVRKKDKFVQIGIITNADLRSNRHLKISKFEPGWIAKAKDQLSRGVNSSFWERLTEAVLSNFIVRAII